MENLNLYLKAGGKPEFHEKRKKRQRTAKIPSSTTKRPVDTAAGCRLNQVKLKNPEHSARFVHSYHPDPAPKDWAAASSVTALLHHLQGLSTQHSRDQSPQLHPSKGSKLISRIKEKLKRIIKPVILQIHGSAG